MIAIVDYDAGNIGSVANALKRLGVEFRVTSDTKAIQAASGVIFPGQGRAGPAIKSLQKSGLDILLPRLTQPFFGICLGMQLMVSELEEDGQKGLGIIRGKCMRFQKAKPVPHMGWNNLRVAKNSRLLKGIGADSYMYFVHSYFVEAPDEFVVAKTNYGGEFASVIAKDNFWGVQFHPEKSAEAGEEIIKNFLKLCGEKS